MQCIYRSKQEFGQIKFQEMLVNPRNKSWEVFHRRKYTVFFRWQITGCPQFLCSCVQSWFHQSLFHVITAESLLIGPLIDPDYSEYCTVIVSPERSKLHPTQYEAEGNWLCLLRNEGFISTQCLPVLSNIVHFTWREMFLNLPLKIRFLTFPF